MTLDEAIKHCNELAEQKDIESLTDRWNDGDEWSESVKEDCKQCAADHRQLAEWLEELKARRLLMDKVCGELAELYGSPCNYSPQDEYMLENGSCEDCCGEISDKECWFRYFHRKFNC